MSMTAIRAASASTGGGFSVVIDDLRITAATFDRLRAASSAAATASSARLGGSGGMAGDDDVLARWRQRYDPMAAALWGATGAATAMLGSIAAKLTETGDAYLAGERAATPNASGPPERLPEVGAAGAQAAAPPSSTGPDAVPDLVAAFYPGGHPDLLRLAAGAWLGLARAWDEAGRAGDSAFRSLLDANRGAAFSTMDTFWKRQYVDCGSRPLFNAVATGAGLLGASCSGLADLIDRTRDAALRAGLEAAQDMSPLDLPAELLSADTFGITELELLLGTGALALSYLGTNRDGFLRALDELVARLRPDDQARLEGLARPEAPSIPLGLALTDVGDVLGVGLRGSAWDGVVGAHPTPDRIHLTRQRATHILNGDDGGGGHRSGTGTPGKSEFPQSWTLERVLRAALSVARDPTTANPGRMSRWVAVGVRDGVKIRVITEPDGEVVTAFPQRGRGVVYNPK